MSYTLGVSAYDSGSQLDDYEDECHHRRLCRRDGPVDADTALP